MTAKHYANYQHIECQLSDEGIAQLILNRPQYANAFNDQMIAELISAIDQLASDKAVRGLLLCGHGKHFSAGADITWMRSMLNKSQQYNQLDAYQLATLLAKLDQFPHPTVAAVQGCAFGGALGLICCCDMVFAADHSQFCLSEVKLGLVPATIAPYVIRAIGIRQARRYMLSAEPINSQTAQRIHLVHELAASEHLALNSHAWLKSTIKHSPNALTTTKRLCDHCHHQPIDDALLRYTSELIAKIRVSQQGQEGLTAFLEKRPPNW
ncbi:enoyl-CoA hydratase-related protein [Vibrio pacinii]|uniref:enoyl-CoA hydratase-related protein n=1 Tax=Vibrio pacinii TaxID=170674 RepID=UPI00056FF190|nr:enoyl-CoA hydratase-related protein [Vibrio pacinii]